MIESIQNWASRGEVTTTSSAVKPGLVLCAIALPVCLSAVILGPAEVHWVFISIIVAILVVVIFQILFFTFVDRDRLQSERHVENKMIIASQKQIIGDQKNEMTIDGSSSLIENPQLGGKDV